MWLGSSARPLLVVILCILALILTFASDHSMYFGPDFDVVQAC